MITELREIAWSRRCSVVAARRAFSLLEAVLVAGLLLLLLTLLFTIVAPMLRASQKANQMSDLRQMAAVSLESLCSEVEQSGAPGLVLYPGALSVHGVETITSDGSTVWSRKLTLYSWSRRQLRRSLFPPVPAGLSAPEQGRPFRLQPDQLGLALSAPSLLLCTDLEEFRVAGFSDKGLQLPLVFHLRLKRDQQEFVLEQSASPAVRNLR